MLYESSPKMTWYKGPTLIKALENLKMRKVPIKHNMTVVTDIK